MNRTWKIISGVVAAVVVVGGATLFALTSRSIPTEKLYSTGQAANTVDPKAFEALFPATYESFMKNALNAPAALKYHAAEPKKSKLDTNDYMRVLWNGYAFSKEYNEARGHAYVLSDTIGETKTARIGAATNLTCMYCKSAEVPGLIQQMGNSFYNTKLLEGNNKDLFKHGISCSDCHDPQSMALRITRPALTEALARQGIDVSKATEQQMRSYVCAQCHVTYFFNPKDNNKVYFPWDKGYEASQIYDYETNTVGLTEWTQPATGAGMIKARHPEFEMFQGSVHEQAGLSCADCHMPLMKQGETKISSHWLTSPMATYQQSCAQCHKQTEQEMRKQVITIQDRAKAEIDRAGEANKAATEAIEKAKNTAGVDAKLLKEAQDTIRQSQFYWDLISSENSTGFHNSPKMMQTLSQSIDLARQAQLKAMQAIAAAR
ncbi:MAG: ammonia-forming cytochrome c nitrite reductase subunit c552 [Mycobacterium leprae]